MLKQRRCVTRVDCFFCRKELRVTKRETPTKRAERTKERGETINNVLIIFIVADFSRVS